MNPRYAFDAGGAYESLRDDFDASLTPELRRALCSDAWWAAFRQFVYERQTGGKARGERIETRRTA